jgi:hypothetical protein
MSVTSLEEEGPNEESAVKQTGVSAANEEEPIGEVGKAQPSQRATLKTGSVENSFNDSREEEEDTAVKSETYPGNRPWLSCRRSASLESPPAEIANNSGLDNSKPFRAAPWQEADRTTKPSGNSPKPTAPRSTQPHDD